MITSEIDEVKMELTYFSSADIKKTQPKSCFGCRNKNNKKLAALFTKKTVAVHHLD